MKTKLKVGDSVRVNLDRSKIATHLAKAEGTVAKLCRPFRAVSPKGMVQFALVRSKRSTFPVFTHDLVKL